MKKTIQGTVIYTNQSFGFLETSDKQSHFIPPQELKKALLDLYKATNGDTWTTKTNWNTGNDICTWYGVKCLEHMHNVTTDLVLKSNNLTK